MIKAGVLFSDVYCKIGIFIKEMLLVVAREPLGLNFTTRG